MESVGLILYFSGFGNYAFLFFFLEFNEICNFRTAQSLLLLKRNCIAMNKFVINLCFILVLVNLSTEAQKISYVLSFPEPQTHYVEVEMVIEGVKSKSVNMAMPVWAPGSYMVRDFPRNVESIFAFSKSGSPLVITKTKKNSWNIQYNEAVLKVKYKVYAYELTVRTSFIDDEHAFLNGSSIFMFIEGLETVPHQVKIVPFASWKVCSVALPKIHNSDWEYSSENYDLLIDSPFEIGNHQVFNFDANGVKHEVAFFGSSNANLDQLRNDMIKICNESTTVFGNLPCKYYLFIIHNVSSGGGGLEHLNSCTVQANRFSYNIEKSYLGTLSTIAHEYFHLWNVKRMRPIALGPFNYNEENYTNMLYVSEGFTAYYDDLITRRAGLCTPAKYLETIAGNISYLANTPGNSIQSVADASFDAWIKYYKTNENSTNTTVSYYTKGSLIALILDLKIREVTGNRKSLDSLMKAVYTKYYLKLNRGFTDDEFKKEANLIAGKDLNYIFDRYVYGTDSIPFNDFLSTVGLKIEQTNLNEMSPSIGATFTAVKNTVAIVTRNSPAWFAGLNVNDEVIAIDNYRVTDDIAKMIQGKPLNKTIKLLINRAGVLKEMDVMVMNLAKATFAISKIENSTPLQTQTYNSWIID